VTWYSTTEQINNNKHIIRSSDDAYFNIIVYGATYAKIYYDSECIDMIKNDDNTFIIPRTQIGASYNNPMFCLCRFYDEIFVHTDGNKITRNNVNVPRAKLSATLRTYGCYN
jgi:hypothetical protein